MITHGVLDYLLLVNGTLATIQNLTWNVMRGFQKPPTEPLVVPDKYRLLMLWDQDDPDRPNVDSKTGVEGIAHTERGLTFTSVSLGGHEMSRYAPGAAYRQLEFLLGRIQSLHEG